jgi:EAL domain-containing protein (putative c-di-GMP-specific phosphodiesterase class I)
MRRVMRRTAVLTLLAVVVFAVTAWERVPNDRQGPWAVSAFVLVRLTWLPFALLALREWARAQRGNAFHAGVAHPTQPQPDGVTSLRSAKVRSILDAADRLEIHLQPVVRLSDDTVVGFEALSRFRTEPYRPPDRWFADAHELDMGTELELCALRAAVDQLRLLPPGTYLSLNVSPATLDAHDLMEVLRGVDPERIVIELTEHAVVQDYELLNTKLASLRSAGVGLAVDDAGAGFASLRHVLRLTPALIKLDRTLTAGIDGHRGQMALAASLVRFAADTGATVVAEGIERPAEMECLRDVGVEHGQGFLLAAPATVADLARHGLLFHSACGRTESPSA